MRKHLKDVPVYVSVGHLAVSTADHMVGTGHAHSLRGRALLLLDNSALEIALTEMDADPEIIQMILRAALRVDSEKAAKAVEERG